jgi:hypothetical protein
MMQFGSIAVSMGGVLPQDDRGGVKGVLSEAMAGQFEICFS